MAIRAKAVVKEPEKKVVVPKAVEPKVTKSSKIVELYQSGAEIADIARKLGIRYEFAYQVAKRFAAKSGTPFSTHRAKGTTKADQIKELFDTGLTISQIAKELGTHNSYVWQVVSAYRKTKV